MNRPNEDASAQPAPNSPLSSAAEPHNPYKSPGDGESTSSQGGPSSPAKPARPPGPTYTRYVVLLWLCLAATIAYVSRNTLAVAATVMMEDLDLSINQMSYAMSAFFWSYAFVQIPSGWFADRLGSRKSLTLFAVLWSVATAMMVLATFGRNTRFEIPWAGFVLGLPLAVLCVSRFINGIAQAGLFPGCTNTISKWFSPHERAFPSGALACFMSIGGAGGGILAGWMLGPLNMSWELMFICFAIPGFIWAAGYYLWFRDRPEDHRSISEEELETIRGIPAKPADEVDSAQDSESSKSASSSEEEREKTPWLALVSSPAMWCICTQQFFRAACYMFFASWFPTYLQATRGVSLSKSAVLNSIPLFTLAVGSLMGGGLSDYVLRRTGSRRLGRQGVAIVSLLVCASLCFGAYFIENPNLAVLVISLGTFCYALGSPVGYAITIDMGGKHVATVFSTMNMSGNIGAALFPVVVARFQNAFGWESVLLLFVGMFIAAAICWALLRPNGTVFDQSLLGRK